MSTIQGDILNSIQLGKHPLIIVAEDKNDAAYLSILISNHLRPKDERKSAPRACSLSDNYFYNPALHQLLQNTEDTDSFTDAILLIIEEGFDTKKLYGISLSADAFKRLNTKLLPQAKYLFILSDFILQDGETILSPNELNLPWESTMVISNKVLMTNPEDLLTHLSKETTATVIDTEKISHQTLPDDDQFIATISNYTGSGKRNFPISMTTFDQQTQVSQCCILYTPQNRNGYPNLFQNFKQLYLHSENNFHIHVVCKTQDDLDFYKDLTTEDHWSSYISFYTCLSESLPQKLNSIIQQENKPFIWIDDLQEEYSISDFIRHDFNLHAFCYGKPGAKENLEDINLIDLLTKAPIESSILFCYKDWTLNGSFDESLSDDYCLWDMGIRILQQRKDHAVIIPSKISNTKQPSTHEKSSEAYRQIILKHKDLIEESLGDVIHSISKDQYLSQKEMKNLQVKISSLQLLLTHSKDELRSLNELTAQLQLRIQGLESGLYYRIKTKIVRIKKIFFKKKSPGGGNMKRILQFIRFAFSKAGFGIFRKVVKGLFKKIYLIVENRPVQIVYLDEEKTSTGIHNYHDWIRNKLNPETLDLVFKESEIKVNPKISIIMPVYNTPLKYLKESIESVLAQQYDNWELCIADDLSTEAKVRKILHAYAVKDKRIKVVYRTENGHISAASNSALEIASGDYVLLMDHDDLITVNCLWEVVKCLQEKPEAEIIYSDEDKINDQRIHQQAHFKPDWAPDHLLSRNYMGHVVVIKKNIIDQIRGFRIGFEGSQDYDLLLRATEICQHIIHIPKVLYHWRIHSLSAAQGEDVKPYAYIAAKRALEEALLRRGLTGNVKFLSGLRGYRIDYGLQTSGKVSIIIPSKDQKELLKNTIDSILQKTDYKNYEIIILNNNSHTSEFYDFIKEYTSLYPELITCIEAHFPFNFSKLMNIGVRAAKGEFILLLNNDVEVIHEDWLNLMVAYAQQPRMGAVGVKLLYPDDTIQHAGVIIGLGGIAGHSFVGAYKDEPGYFNYIQSVNNYSAVTAACLLCRKEAYEAVGGMDETFEVEYNDVDFCLKLMDAGYFNVYLPQVELYHYESATRGHPHQSKVSYERHLKEMKLFKDKWQKYIDHDPYYNPNLNLGVHDFSMNFSS
ncbi:MAG: glycosyltransferase family 2 protein [Chitinophagaceae bacterium]|nr:glycosyltransferase family 2 protein [Chitinophagaceae bacterium]